MIFADRRAWNCFAAAALLALSPLLRAESAPLRVRFDSHDHARDGQPVVLDALLFTPDEARFPQPHPAVVALHGCGGVYSARRGPEHELSPRHRDWAERLVAQGYAVLFPDSFGPRGARAICTIAARQGRVSIRSRSGDALGALAWLAARPDVDAGRIAIIGWSHGAMTLLATIDDGAGTNASQQIAGAPSFRAALAFYPGCRATLALGDRWHASVPMQMHLAALDDWTAPGPCLRLAESARTRGMAVESFVYAEAHHGFDAPGRTVAYLPDVRNGVNPGGGVHSGPNPAARAEALPRAEAFLRDRLGVTVVAPATQGTAPFPSADMR